jgi:zinc finger CCHC domain-containing protein 9
MHVQNQECEFRFVSRLATHLADKYLFSCSGDKLPYASCFICNGTGHLAKDCPQNTNGLYPKGGCCHICQSIHHLAKDCPQKPHRPAEDAAHEDDDSRPIESTKRKAPKEGRRGEDFEDDFTVEHAAHDDADDDGAGDKKKKKQKKMKS